MVDLVDSRRRFLKLGVSGAVVVVVAGVGAYLALQQPSPPPSGPTLSPTPTVPALAPTLIEKGKEEGTITVYSAWLLEELERLGKAFQAKFGIKFETIRARSGELALRYMTEYRAGKHGMDVALSSSPLHLPGLKEDVFAQYTPPEAAVYPQRIKDPGGRWYGVAASTMAIAYNTDLVKGDDIPKNHLDILHSRFKDAVGARHYSTPHPYLGIQVAVGKDKFDSWLEGLSKQNPKITKSGGEEYALLKGREVKVNIASYVSRIVDGIKAGDPVDFVRRPGTVLSDIQLVAVGKNSPHPNAARLFANYVLSEEAQRLIAEWGVYVSTRPGVVSRIGEGVGVGVRIESKDLVEFFPYTEEELIEIGARVKRILKETA